MNDLINAVTFLYEKKWSEREVRVFFLDIKKGLALNNKQFDALDIVINILYPKEGV